MYYCLSIKLFTDILFIFTILSTLLLHSVKIILLNKYYKDVNQRKKNKGKMKNYPET